MTAERLSALGGSWENIGSDKLRRLWKVYGLPWRETGRGE
jgi:hypothetical protein